MKNLINEIARIGSNNKSQPLLYDVNIFSSCFNNMNLLISSETLDIVNDGIPYRELMIRYLLLNAVLDQGPDMDGVRELLTITVNESYKRGIHFLHNPSLFFSNIHTLIEIVNSSHEEVKNRRESSWQSRNNTSKTYNLFMDNTSQTIQYLISRWGVPLSIPLALSKNSNSNTPLLDYIQSNESLEQMSINIKDNKKYGLGKEIGDKAAHLFAKWIAYSYPIITKKSPSWGQYAFEVPFDSNAGRVLFRTGFFKHYAKIETLKHCQMIQENSGKNGKNYLRITNIRGVGADLNLNEIDKDIYNELVKKILCVNKRDVSKIQIQRIPSLFLYQENKYSIGDFDDGLMFIGTNYCFNHDYPNCKDCPLNKICHGNTMDKVLIDNYRT